MPVIAYIGIGSNIGDREANCLKAVELLAQAGKVTSVSSLYYTEPVGYKEQDDFINAVATVETDQSPEKLLDICHSIENTMGRTRTVRWGPRTIDLDILFYGDQVVNGPDLLIPHPAIGTRKFVLAPLVEIAPEMVHPVLNTTSVQMLQNIRGSQTVLKCRPGKKTS